MTFIRRCVKEIKIIKYYEYIPKVNTAWVISFAVCSLLLILLPMLSN